MYGGEPSSCRALARWTELGKITSGRIAAGSRRRVVLLAALVVAALVTGISVAATQWLIGAPAPAPVVSDFKAYTPQLGFHPEPGKAVFVAEDGAIKLYATTNREGTYCVVVDEPWKHANAGDGGTCVSKQQAAFPITAGLVGGASGISVVAGRVADERTHDPLHESKWRRDRTAGRSERVLPRRSPYCSRVSEGRLGTNALGVGQRRSRASPISDPSRANVSRDT